MTSTTTSDLEILDWQVTKSIYEEDCLLSISQSTTTCVVASIANLKPNSLNLAVLYPGHDRNGVFEAVMEPDFPSLSLSFTYEDLNDELENALPRSVEIILPAALSSNSDSVLFDWYTWIANQVKLLLSDASSSSLICDFIANDSLLAYFTPSAVSTFKHATILRLESAVPYLTASPSFQIDTLYNFENPFSKKSKYISQTDDEPLERAVVGFIWNSIPLKCPICLDEVHFKETTMTNCGHRACAVCLEAYITSQMENFATFGPRYPFVCVIPSCKQDLSFDFVQKLSKPDQFSSFKEYWQGEGWKESEMSLPNIQMCPRRRCHSDKMKRLIPNSPLIYCDSCGQTWCERCLKCIQGSHDECDETMAHTICSAYISLPDSSEKKSEIDRKHPWMKSYVSWKRTDESSLLEWLDLNASQCPTCGLGIERTEGCDHMECPSCHTHYCYNCKKPFDGIAIYNHACFHNPDIFLQNFAF